ncbi:MAG TPA: hypothetical protein VL382_01635 [Terriglobales bacterium]|nr:hypothetical protein [Terriglobales bacterium]
MLGILCALVLALPAMGQLQTRPPADENARPDAIPEGSTFTIRLRDTIDTRKQDRGKHFQGEVQEDLVTPSGEVIPRGRKVEGHIADIYRGLHASVVLSFDKIETRHGWVPLAATVIGVPGEHGVRSETGAEGEINRNVDKKRAVESAVVGAAVGATAGAIAGGGKGAAIGAAIGAAGGGGAGVLLDRDLKLEKGQALELRLDRPIIVPSHN